MISKFKNNNLTLRLVLILSLTLPACYSKTERIKLELKETEAVVLPLDSCLSCSQAHYDVKLNEIDSIPGNFIAEPVAIEVFNLNQKLAKFDGKSFIDSLPEKFRNPDRQEIYRTYDIYGIYQAIIRPELEKLSIEILDSVSTDQSIIFKSGTTFYIVDMNVYNEIDGVLFFHPDKKPIFWTTNRTTKKCIESKLVNCYYNSIQTDSLKAINDLK